MGEEDIDTRGHRVRTRVDEIVLEAWAPTKDECVGEAVRALVASFAETDAARPSGEVALALDDPTDEDLLVAVLDEVVHQVRAQGLVAVDVSIDERTGATEGRVDVRFATVTAAKAASVGAMPTAVSVRDLDFRRRADRWRCRVTVEI